MLSANKGEWSEIYALLKLLGDQRVFAGDANLEKIENLFYPIIKILRNESGNDFEYELINDLVIISGGEEELRIPVVIFSEQAANLLERIKGEDGVFSIPEIEDFMSSIYCKKIKAKSSSKTDIKIIIHDMRINQAAELGFSIKSQLGGDSTLLNAGKTTNFIYQIKNINLSLEQIDRINHIDSKNKIKDRLEEIKKLGGEIEFYSLENNVFKNNLILIDSFLPNILGNIIHKFFSSSLNSIIHLTEDVTQENPINYDTQFLHSFYEYKIKRFLSDIALGLMPSKVWTGVYDATGGYLIVKNDGEIVCYHIYNRNKFEDYLYHNTRLETASSSRHNFGKIYEVNDVYYIKLNLQIRFI